MIGFRQIFVYCIVPVLAFGGRVDKYSMKYSLTPVSPKLTIIFVTDSVPKGSVDEVQNFLNGGINFLRNNGLNYLNVFHPYGNCSSSQGYAGMTTGTFPSYTGITNNSWIDVDGVSFKGSAQDNNLNGTAAYDPTNGKRYWLDPGETPADNPAIGTYYSAGPMVPPTFIPTGTGVSPNNYIVDNLSDQLMLFSNSQLNTTVYSISTDPTTATLLAGRLGKAIWRDEVSGLFSTSQYYFPSGIPDWVNQFNAANPVPPTIVWNPVYPEGSAAYNFPGAQNYSGSAIPELSAIVGVPLPSGTFFNQTIPSTLPSFGAGIYIFSPPGIEVFFNFMQTAINQLLSDDPNSRLVLWVNIASFDILGYYMGTQVQESIDIIYQLDQGLGKLIKFVEKKLPLSECLFVLLNDEGKYPSVPEVLQSQGYNLPMRTKVGFPITSPPPFSQQPTDLIARLNQDLITNLPPPLNLPWVYAIIPPFIYMNAPNPALGLALPNFYSLSDANRTTVINEVIRFMLLQPGIKNAWAFSTLQSFPFEREDQGRFFKLHLFQDMPPINIGLPTQNTMRRSGEVIFQSTAFNYVTSGDPGSPFPNKGVDHTSAYDYDSHSSLYLFQAGRFQGKTITDSALIQQLPISLSEILQVPRPSAASADIKPLPHLNPSK